MKLRRFFAMFLIAAMLFTQESTVVFAGELAKTMKEMERTTAKSGVLGDNGGFSWTYDEESCTLTITGEDTGLRVSDIKSFRIRIVKKAIFQNCVFKGSVSYLLNGLTGCETAEFINCDTKQVTDMSNMFLGCASLLSLDLSTFDTSNVTNMSDMFRDCSSLSSLNFSTLDTSNVTDMSGMFYRSSSLLSLDLSMFGTSNVTDMSEMFYGCSGLEELNISGFDTSNVTDMSSMFGLCSSILELDVSGFDTSNVTDMSMMFDYCESLTDLDVSNFNTEKVTTMSAMFEGCSGLTSLDVSGFDITHAPDMMGLFMNCSGLTELDLSHFDTSNVTEMNGWFYGCSGLTELDLSGFDTSNVTQMNGLFSGCSGLTELDLSNFDTSNVKEMKSMFYNCSGLTYLDLSNFDTSNVTSMYQMFWGCSGLMDLNIDSFDTSHVLSMERMFSDCSGLTTLDLSRFNTGQLQSLQHMFSGCKNLITIDLSSFNTYNVYSFASMFYDCENLRAIDLSSFKVDATYTYNYYRLQTNDMFGNCMNLEEIRTPYYMRSGVSIDLPTNYYDEDGNIFSQITEENCSKKLTKNDYLEILIEADKFLVKVVDSSGCPMKDVLVTYDSKTGYTNANGVIQFDMSTAESPIITAEHEGYVVWTNDDENYDRYFGNENRLYQNIVLYGEHEGDIRLAYAYIESGALIQDVLTEYQILGIEDGKVQNFKLNCKVYDTSNVLGYGLYQGNKLISFSNTGKFDISGEAGFVSGKACYVKVKKEDGTEMSTQLNIAFIETKEQKTELKFGGDDVSITVGDNVPLLGGSTIEFEIPDSLPLYFFSSEDKMRIGINYDGDSKKKEEGKTEEDEDSKEDEDSEEEGDSEEKADLAAFEKLKQHFDEALKADEKDQKAAADKLKDLVKNDKAFELPGGEFDATMIGYLEADKGQNILSGALIVVLEGKSPTWGFNTVVWVVPVTVQFNISVNGEVKAEISYDMDKGIITSDLSLKPSFSLNAFGGIGAGVAAVGAYGSLGGEADFGIAGENLGLRTFSLTGQVGVKAFVGNFVYEKPWAKQTWYVYPNADDDWGTEASPLKEEIYSALNYEKENLGYLSEESQWQGNAVAVLNDEVTTSFYALLEDTYRNAQPVMVVDGDEAYAAFLRADEETGEIYTVVTKLVYGTWQEPVRVDDAAVLDGTPQMLVDEDGKLWLTYTATMEDTDVDTLLDYAQNQRIVVGEIDKDSLQFTKIKEFSGNGFVHTPQLTLVDGNPTLVWVEAAIKDENSVLASNSNVLYKSAYINDVWSNAAEVKTMNCYVQDVAIGDSGYACVIDVDTDLNSTEDRTLKIYNWSGTETESIAGVTGNISYGVLPGETQASFLWNGENQLCNPSTVIPAQGITAEYVVCADKIYYSAAAEDSAELVVVKRNIDGSYSAPIQLTDEERYLENLSVVTVSGSDILLGMHTNAIITEEAVIPEKNLVWSMVKPVYDVELSVLSFDRDITTGGENVPVKVCVANLGMDAVEAVKLYVNNTVVATHTVSLQPGASTELTIDIVCPSNLTEYSLQVVDASRDLESDYTPDNNTTSLKLGYSDIAVTADLQRLGNNKSIVALIENKGVESASGVVVITNENGTELLRTEFADLSNGNVILLEQMLHSSISDTTLYVSIETDAEEFYTYNNSDSVYVPAEEQDEVIPDGWNQADDGNWYYYKDGEVDTAVNGITYNEVKDEWWYAVEGKAEFSYTGLTCYYDTWYYVEGGVLNWGYTGLTCYYDTWYYVEGGVLNWNYTGLTCYYDTWYYVENGVLNWGYTGLTCYYGTWYYVENGVLNWGYTGLTLYYGTWYYVENGVLNWGYTGLTCYYDTWYYVEGGVLNWGYTGLTLYYGTWYYVEGGVLNWNYTGLTYYYGIWYYVGNGVLDWSFTGDVWYNGILWHVENGVLVCAV